MHYTCQGEGIINCEQFSTLCRLQWGTAHVVKFMTSKVKGSCLTAVDIGHAENNWVKEPKKMLTQSEQFSLWQQQFGLYCGMDGICTSI